MGWKKLIKNGMEESKWKNDLKTNFAKFQLACDQPLLIDDECDGASIDISSEKPKDQDEWDEEKQEEFKKQSFKNKSTYKKNIDVFKRRTYVGYTATPLANAFINYFT